VKHLVATLIVVGVLATVGAGVRAASSEAWIPAVASFVIPGLGQLLNDQVDKAILHFVVDVGINALGYYLTWSTLGWYSAPIWGLAHLGWALYSGYDAYTVAKEKGFSIGLTSDGLTFAYHF
jgi:TM2 domain-containing membrane protein YozV